MKSKVSILLSFLAVIVAIGGIIGALYCFNLAGNFVMEAKYVALIILIVSCLLAVAFFFMGSIVKLLSQVKYNVSRVTSIGLEGSVFKAKPVENTKTTKKARPDAWLCDECGTENHVSMGFCSKCFKTRTRLKVKLKDVTTKGTKALNHTIRLAPAMSTAGNVAASNGKAPVKNAKAKPNSWTCKHCGTSNNNAANYCANCYRTK